MGVNEVEPADQLVHQLNGQYIVNSREEKVKKERKRGREEESMIFIGR